jgi:signal transduction histidine kinase
VFAYTSPVVLEDGQRPAFFHFEMPVKIFQDLLEVDYGRMYVIDEDGFLIADSKTTYPNPLEVTTYEEYFPRAAATFPPGDLFRLLPEMRRQENGIDSYVHGGETHYAAFRTLETFDWLLVYELPESTMLGKGGFSVYDLELSVFFITLLVISGALISVFFISKRITEPVINLGIMTKKISEGALDTKINVKGDDEIHDLAESFNSMAGSLKRTIELEKKLAIAEQDVKNEKLAAIGALSARIAHDIRNPLSTMKTAVDLLQTNAITKEPKVRAQLERLERAVDAITFQVNSVLEFVRTRSLRLAKCSLREIISASLEDVQIPPGIAIETPQNDYELFCDSEKIGGVFSNLVLNAIQALGENGQIVIRMEEQEESIVVEVEDSGPGIPEEILPRLFDLVFTTKEEGTGLGLVSCKAAVEQHGGSIRAHNNPTTFVVTLPKQTSAVLSDSLGLEELS